MSELALPYVPIDPTIHERGRFTDFVDALNIEDDPNAEWYIIALLLWAGRMKVDGNIGKPTPKRLAKICRWPGCPDELLAALISTGWLIDSKTKEGWYIEGWERHGGRVLKKRIKWRDKKRKQRNGLGNVPGDIPGTSPGRPPDVPTCPRPKGEGEGEGEPKGEETTPAVAPFALNPDNTPSPWVFGDPIATVADLHQFSARAGLGLQIEPKTIKRARAMLAGHPITTGEAEEAMTRTLAMDGTGGLSSKVAYFLGVVEGMRRDALKPNRDDNATNGALDWLKDQQDE
jgi:hypothetical protein